MTKLELKGTTSYVYDTLGRLASVTEPGGKLTEYKFDRAGNRLTQTATDGSDVTITSYDYDERVRLMEDVEAGVDEEKTTSYVYDPNENMLSKMTETIADDTGSTTLGLGSPGISAGDEITFALLLEPETVV